MTTVAKEQEEHQQNGTIVHEDRKSEEEVRKTIAALEKEQSELKLRLAQDPLCTRTRKQLAVVLVDLGTNLKFTGRDAEALEKYHESLRYNSEYSAAYYNLGVAANGMCKFEEAANYYEKALEYNPCCVEALTNLGLLRRMTKDLEGAVALFTRALRVRPYFKIVSEHLAVSLNDLGTQYKSIGRVADGIQCYERATVANPFYSEAYYNLGVAHAEISQFEKAIYYYELAVHFKPDFAEAWNNLGVMYKEANSPERAVECYEKALALNDTFAQTKNNLAVLYSMNGNMDRALKLLREAIALQPLYAEAHNNLGVILRDEGEMHEALDCFSKCLALCPAAENAAQNKLLALNFSTEHTLDEVQKAHLEWGKHIMSIHGQNNKPHVPSPGESRTRKLRVGYVSPDFYLHSVSYYIHNILRWHNQDNIEVYCFANVARPDSKTFTFRQLVPPEQWIDITGVQMEEAAELIRKKNIDILVDLTGHTSTNRLDIFCKKPAPIQVTWIGYPNTTGLPTIDYRITDNYVDPKDTTNPEHYAETLFRLPHSFLCYCPDTPEYYSMIGANPLPAKDTVKAPSFQTPASLLETDEAYSVNYRGDVSPDIGNTPANQINGYVTFGTFNNMAKINKEVVKAWCEIMKQLPTCRFILKSKPFADLRVRRNFLQMFEAEGMDTSRIELMGIISHHYSHLQAYERLDITLDCWPYAGTTTSCEALWMGVPMVTLRGESHAASVGASLLSNIGCPELIANTPEEYIKIAVDLAKSPKRIAEYRQSLRKKMVMSPLCDGKTFIRDLEQAYRTMWRAYLEGRKATEIETDEEETVANGD